MHKITKRKVWQCGFTNCDNKFDTRIEAEMHMWLCNYSNCPANILVFNIPVKIPEWQCDTCGIVFDDKSESDRHVYLCALESGEISEEKAKVEEPIARARLILGQIFYLVTDSIKAVKDYEKVLDCISGFVPEERRK